MTDVARSHEHELSLQQPLRLFAALLVLLWGARAASADSAFEFPMPEEFGTVAAGTYDGSGARLGNASFIAGLEEDGSVRLEATSAIEGSASTRFLVKLETLENGKLRPIYEESRSIDIDGHPLGVMSIDHREGVVTCEPAAHDKDGHRRQMKLPDDDRVLNIPLHLLFQPLVRGEVEEISFKIVLCRPDPRIIDALAQVVEGKGAESGIVEVQYTIDLGFWNRIAAPFVPTLSMWFDSKAPNGWIGHRVPLYTKGPTVSILREGIDPHQVGTRGD